MSTDLELARGVIRALTPTLGPGSSFVLQPEGRSSAARIAFTRRYLGTAMERFGEPVMVAAATNVTQGACKWCLARSYATAHRQAFPKVTAATRALLGEPCPRDISAFRKRLAGHVAAARTSAREFRITREAAEQARSDVRVSELTALMSSARDELARLRPDLIASMTAAAMPRVPGVMPYGLNGPVPSEGRVGPRVWKRR